MISIPKVNAPLYTIVPYFNPWQSKARIKHTERAVKHFHDSGAQVVLVEVAFGNREFTFSKSGGLYKYIGLRTKDELWLKENAINIGVQNLPYDFEYVSWQDGDLLFTRPNWVGETIHQLQHYKFVQMFSQANDMGPNYEVLSAQGPSFIKLWQEGKLKLSDYRGPIPWPGWPGLAWACTHEAWDIVGGLMDFALWGGSDYDTAWCLIEQAAGNLHLKAHNNYQTLLAEWEDRCRWGIRRNVGLVEGMVLHHWHGKKDQRMYNAKQRLMDNEGFDPLRHLKRDSQGLWQLHDDGSESFIQFRDVMRQIAKLRNEDSIDV